MIELILAALVLGVLGSVGYLIVLYNLLVAARQRVRQAWAGVDVELSRRHALVPNLVESLRAWAAHERATLEQVTASRERARRLRPEGSSAAHEGAEAALASSLALLNARVEAYPELASSDGFRRLKAELAHTEDRLAAALRLYNGNVQAFNTRIESFPAVWCADLLGFEPAAFFRLPLGHAALQAPQVAA